MSPQLRDNFARLGQSGEFKPFRDWLAAAREKVRDDLETLGSEFIPRLQGEAKALRDLQNMLSIGMK